MMPGLEPSGAARNCGFYTTAVNRSNSQSTTISLLLLFENKGEQQL